MWDGGLLIFLWNWTCRCPAIPILGMRDVLGHAEWDAKTMVEWSCLTFRMVLHPDILRDVPLRIESLHCNNLPWVHFHLTLQGFALFIKCLICMCLLQLAACRSLCYLVQDTSFSEQDFFELLPACWSLCFNLMEDVQEFDSKVCSLTEFL